jgi:hypothetical protein
MKYLLVIVFCLLLCGCDEAKQRRADRDKATITTSFYLTTVLHDEHLFIMGHSGYFIHHPNCPCLKPTLAEKPENFTPPTIIFDSSKSVLIRP